MKRVWQKINRGELLREYLLFGCLVLFSGSLLIVQITKIADRAISTADGTRFTVLSIALFIAVVIWAGISLYKKSASYILWYKEIFDSVPIPLIVTGEDAGWQQINKATRKTMDMQEDRSFENLNSRHLINMDGSIKNKVWFHKGEQYQVTGKRLRCDGKHTGYLIFLNGENGISESVKRQTEMIVKVNRLIQRLSAEAGHFRDCTSNISRHMLWQSSVITDLFAIIDEFASSGLKDSQALDAKMYAIKEDIQFHMESNQMDLQRMQQVHLIIKELNNIRDPDAELIHKSDNAS